MGPADAVLVAGAGLLAGAVNAVAGGGTLIAFPALLATGLPALTANITSSAGLVTGYAGGALGYRRELAGQTSRLKALGPPAMLGGLVGAVVLLLTPSDGFRSAVPFLVIVACLLLAVQSRLASLVARRRAAALATTPRQTPGGLVGVESSVGAVTWPTRIGVFTAGAYGSYFGAGLGVVLLGVLGILLVDELQRTNALKTLLSFGVNAIGVVVFLVTAQVSWAYAGILVVTSAVGGVLGARVARRLPAPALRAAVIVLGLVVAVVLLIRG
ncbi:sulfite exporter TauE/SafE family protein [Frankia sp. Mgl5]|uniref:sulfite exporter TauE/SafE family protein n=1 Tax=Frankia sp. Mgl5 TaxID=2933793 RepID=UPI00200BBBC0|nr:sulfite exporter TauE/SafE family protein [Frankia sp. Mgl5]MCK9928057.1 sulfite exporter TauE/SafE family protein [Frankia sp. Mgl5]